MHPIERRSATNWLLLTVAPLQVAACSDFLVHPDAGGIDLFVGITRQWTDGRETVQLSYEAFPEMAIREMGRLAERALNQWPLSRVVVHHRLGDVPAGEASVILGVSSPHRADAFSACRFLIDTLKEDVPIWKKEHYGDGGTEWVQRAG